MLVVEPGFQLHSLLSWQFEWLWCVRYFFVLALAISIWVRVLLIRQKNTATATVVDLVVGVVLTCGLLVSLLV